MISKYFRQISNSQVYFFCKSKALNVRMQCFKINFNRLHIFVYLFLNYYEMAVPKKYSTDKKKKPVQETVTEYLSKIEIDSKNEMSELLEKLLKKGIEQCERGETTPHAQVMAEMKIKHNLKF